MPELPEVEVIRRDLEKEVIGRKIKKVDVRNTKNGMRIIRRHKKRRDFEDALTGAKIVKVDRLGKYLLLGLDNQNTMIVHLGMSGQLIQCKASAPIENHTHVILEFTVGGHLRYVDPRTFGEMFATTKGELGEVKELQKLGLDPLEQPLTWQYFSETLSIRKTKMKALLMDQKFICGIGNIYSDEILFLAGIRFDRNSEDLVSAEVRRLYRAIQEILQDAIRYRGTSADDEQYRDLYGNVGEYQQFLKVYQREGQPCRRCRTPIERSRFSSRSTFYCPQCQV
ncbi:MAG TPA: bifunctional DNA-formamidopyrimidine glycosylase/DNA-(apurinic or apyrimidinic site) lyase [Actinomycetota bacterium]|nr:bifunctional DNA-formamidopyrimidine glycosylase/DNA-(apurinic or apyrimidinic site) lyase [Actinomycetota bacterium]